MEENQSCLVILSRHIWAKRSYCVGRMRSFILYKDLAGDANKEKAERGEKQTQSGSGGTSGSRQSPHPTSPSIPSVPPVLSGPPSTSARHLRGLILNSPLPSSVYLPIPWLAPRSKDFCSLYFPIPTFRMPGT